MPTQLEIDTPEGKTFSDMVDLVVVPGSEGELGILPAHAPLVSALQPGELRYTKDGQEYSLAVGAGLVEVQRDKVAVLSDLAVNEADIDEHAVEHALESAQKALAEGGDEDPDKVAALHLAIQKSLAQLHVKRKRRSL